ncbi:2-aminoethylphosphonate ABC transport system ATP-binding subunit PhnT [Streptomyces sp. V2]|uniref:ABC transporter ATP-binding protein n=1 Tax=Streptomyces sp. V2 TaxID=1424099 RepID=UPI000D66A576|nr:ABC transporter ATP-binding protein [Streptomyces sp. V2]PWG13474.1 2-aminoethylphosphonate ABC transport system ATP-binding subunit PhnT [Streptomyces sp. V2]
MIRFDSVSVAYDGHTVLDALDLTVAPGEVMALLGPSGSGKTTALRAVAGFVRPSAGRVFLGERDVTDVPPYRRGIGMVVQQYALFPHLRVEDNVAFGLKARRVDRGEIRRRVGEALELTGMGAYARRRPRELSGGQQQRVAIARALAIRPEVLLLDEPLSALDARLRSEMLAELARLHRELPDVTILYVTHDQVEALTLADRIAVLDRARLQACGTPRELYRAPGNEFTASFVGGANLLPVHVADGVAEFAGTRLKVDAEGVTGPATLCVRPHLVGLGDGPNQLTGPVREIQWRGATHRLYVEVAGHTVMADVRELRDPPVHGAHVTLHFSPEDAVLLHD